MYEYDHQLLESVAVRRNRLVSALLFGSDRTRRTFDDNVRRLLVSLVLAALLAAGCVAYSFVVDLLGQERIRQQELRSSAVLAPGEHA